MYLEIPLRLWVGLMIVGVLANFVIYGLDSTSGFDSGSGWRQVATPENNLPAVDGDFVRSLLGQLPDLISDDNESVAIQSEAGDSRHFFYAGKTYRLSGLVVSGTKSAATLFSDQSDAIRVTVGGRLPDGEVVKAITLNEIVLIDVTDQEKRIRIYE